jgi:hypothetical protein
VVLVYVGSPLLATVYDRTGANVWRFLPSPDTLYIFESEADVIGFEGIAE